MLMWRVKPGFHTNAIAKRNRLRCVRFLAGAFICCVKFSRNKRKRQPIGMLGLSSGNHDWLLANASACVSCSFRYATHATQAIAFEWKPGLRLVVRMFVAFSGY